MGPFLLMNFLTLAFVVSQVVYCTNHLAAGRSFPCNKILKGKTGMNVRHRTCAQLVLPGSSCTLNLATKLTKVHVICSHGGDFSYILLYGAQSVPRV